jgi:glutamine---fructose-6-phosphate transaminase (isomerizing)
MTQHQSQDHENGRVEPVAPDGLGPHTLHEILDQTAAWRDALATVRAQQDALRELWARHRYSDVLVTGCGSPYYLSLMLAPLIQQQLGVRARMFPASELLLFPETVTPPDGVPLLITISRSGRTTEVIRATQAYRAASPASPILAIGVDPGTPLVEQADLALVVTKAQEQSVVQTGSLSAMVVTAQAAVAALATTGRLDAMDALPALGERLLTSQHDLARQLGSDPRYERFYFLGSGLQYGLANEANLKMKEMSLSVSEAFHFLEFRHGPMSMVNDRTLVVGMLSERARDYELAVLREMRAQGAQTLVLADRPVPAEAADFPVIFESGLPETVRSVLYLPVVQLLGYYKAVSKGLNPDQPHNLTAVVELGATSRS